MSKKLILFDEDEFPFKKKFYILMDLLISNQSDSRFESFLLMTIFYLQILSSFFSEYLGVFDSKNSKSDNLLNYIVKILRVKDLFKNNYDYFKILGIILFIIIIVLIIHFIITILMITKASFYSYNKKMINYYIKIFFYIGYNIIYDICFSNFCFNSDELNHNFINVKCSSLNTFIIIFSIVNIIICLFIYIFFSIYYNDSFYLSNSYYSKMSCNYDFYWGINCLIISLLLCQIKSFTKEFFLFYNLIMSIILFLYYIKHYLYYDKYINIFTGIFHLLYMWTSIFSIIFAYLNFKEKGIIYILSSIIICFFYLNIKNRIESEIILKTPFYKINNKFYLLYYFRSLFYLVNNVEESSEDKSLLSGMIKMHLIECPNPNCLLKTKEDIYLPLTNKWSDKNKKEIEDEVFLKNFLIIVMNYFIYAEECSADMYLNLSLYYLKIIGNYCQAIYYYKKVTELKLTLREKFSFIRLKIQISKILVEKLKSSNQQCNELENLDVSIYFKYEELSQNFLDEINNDVNLSLQFWKEFQSPYIEINKKIDFNKVFELTDKIRQTKNKIECIWNNLLKIYSGVNDYFEFYIEYIEQINDDDLKRRDLESLKRKNDNFGDHLNNNFYSVLFNKETGIIIVNGDKGNEGIIELSNKEIQNIFKYKSLELKGMNLTNLMPKIFAKNHSKYIERFFTIGQKKLIDKSDFKSFGKDKDNSIIKINLALKLFPILNDNVYFVSLIIKDNIEDIIFIDDKFIIQGMSLKLMKILSIKNKNLFQDNEIPFYVICRKFVNFYNIFLQGKKNKEIPENQISLNGESKENVDENKKEETKNNEKEGIHENIEISENVELEYEIKLPQFLIEYSEKSNKKEGKYPARLMTIQTESEDITEIAEEYDEEDFLMEEEKYKERELNNNKNNTLSKNHYNISLTPTPFSDTMTPDVNQLSESIDEDSDINKDQQNIVFNKESEEEKIYNNKMNQYKTLFNEGKFNELEELIDSCNNNSSSVEYKFNFTFDKYKYGNNQISYVIRCIDTKNDIGISLEESVGDLDPKISKYKKEKAESIKPLFEVYEEERKEIIELPEYFLSLSLENKQFQKLLQSCKNDLDFMSKTHGQKKDEVLEDENSSQTFQAGFDSGLLKKNRIEEIRSNLLTNISNFYTLKYIKIIQYLISLLSIIFIVIYYFILYLLFKNLSNSCFININLYQSTLWTTELISIFVSLRVLYLKEIINKHDRQSFQYFDFLTNKQNISLYYDYCVNKSLLIYKKLYMSFGFLEMEMSNYLNENELVNIYWDNINISYMEDNYKLYTNQIENDSFPMSIAQLLSNSQTYLQSPVFNSIVENTSFLNDFDNNKISFDYMTFLIIENGYNNILPSLFNKLIIIPNILKNNNYNHIKLIDIIMASFAIIIAILCSLNTILIHLTTKSMIGGMEKVSKIKLEKIEEIIKRIKIFSIYLKKFREKDRIDENYKSDIDIFEEFSRIKTEKKILLNKDRRKRTIKYESSFLNSNGFNTEYKRYIPLTTLKYSFIYYIAFFIYSLICLMLIFSFSIIMVKNTNQLITVHNYIFGKLIATSTSTIEIKCFISECKDFKKFNYSDLVNYNITFEVIKGMKIFSQVSNFYNEKFLLNICAAAFNQETESEKYNNCKIDPIIMTVNNTDNLLNLVEDLIFLIEKQFEINKNYNNSYYRRELFNEENYRYIEIIFFQYFIYIEGNFVQCVEDDLISYLNQRLLLLTIIISFFGVITIVFSIITRIIIIKKLIHYLSVSRCIMKIIPTSIILSTQELETWIESKY